MRLILQDVSVLSTRVYLSVNGIRLFLFLLTSPIEWGVTFVEKIEVQNKTYITHRSHDINHLGRMAVFSQKYPSIRAFHNEAAYKGWRALFKTRNPALLILWDFFLPVDLLAFNEFSKERCFNEVLDPKRGKKVWADDLRGYFVKTFPFYFKTLPKKRSLFEELLSLGSFLKKKYKYLFKLIAKKKAKKPESNKSILNSFSSGDFGFIPLMSLVLTQSAKLKRFLVLTQTKYNRSLAMRLYKGPIKKKIARINPVFFLLRPLFFKGSFCFRVPRVLTRCYTTYTYAFYLFWRHFKPTWLFKNHFIKQHYLGAFLNEPRWGKTYKRRSDKHHLKFVATFYFKSALKLLRAVNMGNKVNTYNQAIHYLRIVFEMRAVFRTSWGFSVFVQKTFSTLLRLLYKIEMAYNSGNMWLKKSVAYAFTHWITLALLLVDIALLVTYFERRLHKSKKIKRNQKALFKVFERVVRGTMSSKTLGYIGFAITWKGKLKGKRRKSTYYIQTGCFPRNTQKYTRMYNYQQSVNRFGAFGIKATLIL